MWTNDKAPAVRAAGAFAFAFVSCGSIAAIHVAPARTPRGRNQTTDGTAAIRIGRAADEEAGASPATVAVPAAAMPAAMTAVSATVTAMATMTSGCCGRHQRHSAERRRGNESNCEFA